MIRYTYEEYIPGVGDEEGVVYVKGSCLSSNQKPTDHICGGSSLIELDTCTLYFYDEENNEWRPWK